MKYLVKWTATVRGECTVEADYPDQAEEIVAKNVVTAGSWQDVGNADVHAYVGTGPGVAMYPCDVVSVARKAGVAFDETEGRKEHTPRPGWGLPK